MSHAADRNLLFGILALQLDFINRDALVAAMGAWVLNKSTSLGQILLNHKALTADTHALLDALVQKHLALHGNDAEKSLAAVSSLGGVRQQLAALADADVQASLVHVAADAVPREDVATIAYVPGTANAQGTRFRIVRPHASGGLGQVSVAVDEELHREVALKEIQDRHAGNADSRARFLLEAEITGGLEHPGIVPVYGLGQYADGRPFYAMRFIKGDSLKDAIAKFHNDGRPLREKSLELRELLERFIDVCNAIQYAHDRGVLHRDLKPGNIMLGKYGETLVVDWGLAKPQWRTADTPATPSLSGESPLIPSAASGSAATMQGSALGTPQYMSPEQAAGRLDQLGPASDIYSLGATLYCLLTGKPPFEDLEAGDRKPALGELLQKVQAGNFPRPRQRKPDLDQALEAVCLKAMALNPQDRYASPQALMDDLKHWLANESVSAWPDPWTVKARRWMGRNRTLVTGVAAAVLVGLVSLALATALLARANDTIQQKNNDLTEANAQIQKQNEDIRQEIAEKEKQRKLAEQRSREAMLALGLVSSEIRDLAEDAMVPAERRAKVLAKLIEKLQEQVDENPATDPIVSLRNNAYLCTVLAMAENESAIAEEKATWMHADQSRSWCTKGLKMVDQWLTLAPDDPVALSRRAALLQVMGSTFSHQFVDDKKPKDDYFAEALAMRRKLASAPETIKIVDQFTPGKAKSELADSLENAGLFEEAFRVHDDLCREHPTPAYFNNRAYAFAKAAFDEKLEVAKKRVYLTEANRQYTELNERLQGTGQFTRQMLVRWAGITQRMVELESSQKNPVEARKHAEKYALMAQQLSTSIEASKHHYGTGWAYYELARLHLAAGENAQARASADACLLRLQLLQADYPRDPNTWNLRVSMCRLQLQMGDVAPAIRGADSLKLQVPEVAMADHRFYRLACAYSVCILAIAKSRGNDPLTDDDKKQQADCRDKAFHWLDNAFKAGYPYFDHARKEDPDMVPLRGDPRFEAILQKYEKK